VVEFLKYVIHTRGSQISSDCDPTEFDVCLSLWEEASNEV